MSSWSPLTAKTVPSELGMKSSTADSATNTEDERKPLLADSSTSPEALSFTDATTETDLNIISLESLIQKQQELIESLLTDQTTPDNLSSAVKIEPTQSLADIATRYASLETERKQLTEAALELGEARGALKKEREEFFEEVRAFRTLRVLVGLDEVIGVDPPLQTVLNEQPQAAQATGVSEPLVHLARPTVPDAAARPKSAAVPEPITVSESAFVPELYAVIEEAPTTAVVAPTSPQIDADTTLFLDSSPTSPSSVPAPTSPTPSPHKIVLRPSTRSLIASYENFKSFRPLTPHETPIVATHAVVRAYAPSNYTDEIALARGDLVHVERVFADSWCLVVHLSAGRKDLRGVVPLGCLKEVHGGASRVCVMEEGDGERSWVGAVRSAGRSVRFREKVEEIASWWGRERVESLEALADAKK
ncbi:hypothetical protein BC830DRAFT_886544 [Chytriomyces sp. MP71]|nr:hypothetical protein BC830DRAFT_886544 [Chytriomyces sp. MP71]